MYKKLQFTGVSAMLGVTFGYAIMGVAIRLFEKGGLDLYTQVYVRLLPSLIISAFLFRKEFSLQKFKSLSYKDWLVFLSMGTIGYAIAVGLISAASIETKLLNVSVIYSTLPLYIYIYALLFKKENFRLPVFVLLLIAIYGVVVISSNSFIPYIDKFGIGEWHAFLAALSFAWFYFARKLLSPGITNGFITVVSISIALVTAILLAFINNETLIISNLFSNEVLLALAIGIAVNIGTTYLVAYAFEHLEASFAGQLVLTESVFSLIIGFVFYKETIGIYGLLGSAIIMFSMYFANRRL